MISKQTILNRVENQVRQQLFGSVMFAVLGLMLAVNFGWLKVRAANNDVTNLTFNVTTGAFTIAGAPDAMAFPDIVYGVSNTDHLATTNVTNVLVTDHRGTGTAWNATVASTNLTAGTNVIDNGHINFRIATGTITNEEGDLNFVTKGTNGLLNDDLTLMSGNTAAAGIFNYSQGPLSLNVAGTEPTGNYTGTITFTLA